MTKQKMQPQVEEEIIRGKRILKSAKQKENEQQEKEWEDEVKQYLQRYGIEYNANQ